MVGVEFRFLLKQRILQLGQKLWGRPPLAFFPPTRDLPRYDFLHKINQKNAPFPLIYDGRNEMANMRSATYLSIAHYASLFFLSEDLLKCQVKRYRTGGGRESVERKVHSLKPLLTNGTLMVG